MKAKANVQLLDPTVVRHRRMELGITESYLGALCGVSSSVIRRLESGYPQDDLSARFLQLLADNLGTHLSNLLQQDRPASHDPKRDPYHDARELGAILTAVREPVPFEALCRVLDWDLLRLDRATAELNAALEPAGATVVEGDSTLQIADDLAPVSRDTIGQVAAATFGLRRPNPVELRTILMVARNRVVRREDLDTVHGRMIGRLRNLGILDNARAPRAPKSDAPRLHPDVIYSLMLDDSEDQP
jgi:transcriptional regulator with XRE-family HTH domain